MPSPSEKIDFTVAIPTYNGADRLRAVLDRLKAQVRTEDYVRWEVLVIDNNSTDRTAQLVREYQQDWIEIAPLRYCCEPQQGASFARMRGVKEARGKWVGFLDDDTIPAPNWVTTAYAFGEVHPAAGAYGSQVHGEYEVEPPQNFEKIASFFAITERGCEPHLYEPQMKMLPPSAGLVVRKQAWCDCVPENLFLSGRSPQSILNSEDLEVVLYLQNAGWQIWYNPHMHIYHHIPRQRLEREALLFLMRSTGLARHHIRMLRLKSWQKPLLFPLGWMRDIYKAIAYFIQHYPELDRDVVTACEMEFLRSSIFSPFYLWKQSWKSRSISP